MSDDRLPRDPLLPTIPAPKDEDPIRLMREVRAACENLGELVQRLSTHLACQELAILTEEHKTNHAHERIDVHAKDLLELRERLATVESIVQAAE